MKETTVLTGGSFTDKIWFKENVLVDSKAAGLEVCVFSIFYY